MHETKHLRGSVDAKPWAYPMTLSEHVKGTDGNRNRRASRRAAYAAVMK